jgi:Leucine-rich repeat (LRR) protein
MDNNQVYSDIPFDLFIDLPKIIRISIGVNIINKFLLGTFQNIPSLKTLDGTSNQITKLETNTLYGTQNLELFRMEYNYLSSIDSIFLGQNNLKCIILGYNRLSSLPNYLFAALSKLIQVALNGNRLTSLPKDLFKKSFNLKSIHLDRNSLSTLPTTIFDGLTNLELITLKENRMLSMSNEVFKSLVNLKHIEIDSNIILESDSNFFQVLKNIESLVLQQVEIDNKLPKFPLHLFDGMTNLKTISFLNHGNPIFPSDLFQTIKQVEVLEMPGNGLKTIPNSFRKLTKLKGLFLASNQIKGNHLIV